MICPKCLKECTARTGNTGPYTSLFLTAEAVSSCCGVPLDTSSTSPRMSRKEAEKIVNAELIGIIEVWKEGLIEHEDFIKDLEQSISQYKRNIGII